MRQQRKHTTKIYLIFIVFVEKIKFFFAGLDYFPKNLILIEMCKPIVERYNVIKYYVMKTDERKSLNI